MNDDFDAVLKAHGLTRNDVLAGMGELWGKWERVIRGRMEGKSYAQLKRSTYYSYGGTMGVEAAGLRRLTNTRFYGPDVAIPEPVREVIRSVRQRELDRGAAWLGPLAYFQEVTS